MAQLKRSEIRLIEKFVAFPNGHGFVLDFSDRTIAEYFEDEFGRDFDDDKFRDRGGSKRNRLVSFCLQESQTEVSALLRGLLERRDNLVSQRETDEPDSLRGDFMVLISKIETNADRPSLDAIYSFQSTRTLDELISDLERSIRSDKPEVALDRLHTYCMKKFAYLLSLEGIECTDKEPLHSRFGKYRNILVANVDLHPVSDLALKSAITIFDRFNDVRNNWTLAHDNELLAHAEARYMFDSISAILKFIKTIEAGRFEKVVATKQ